VPARVSRYADLVPLLPDQLQRRGDDLGGRCIAQRAVEVLR